MKRNPITITIGALLLIVFGLQLCMFQVRKSEVVVITTFGKPTRSHTEPGAYLKWPWPVQTLHRLDQRIQNLEGRFEEVLTSDGLNLMVRIYVGWSIQNPTTFFPKFEGGKVTEAEKALNNLVRSVKNEVVVTHSFSHFVSANEKEMRFAQIEKEMLEKIRERIKANDYGIEIHFVGIKQLGLPEGVTKDVFQRMESERQVLVSKIKSEGEAQASFLRTEAIGKSAKILFDAEAQATEIRGKGEAEAAKSFSIFKQNPDLANLLFKSTALEQFLKEKTTLILDENTPGLDLLHQPKKQP